MDAWGRKQPVTIYDIAARAGVSPATVSRVLRGATRVAEPKKTAVLAAAAALRYRPNLMAKDLASGRSQTVGMVMPELESPFWGRLLTGVERQLRACGYHLLTMGAPDADTERQALDLLLTHQVDGIVLARGTLPYREIKEMVGDIPAVRVCWWEGFLEGGGIAVDNREGARVAMRHLLELGHRRIAYVSGPMWQADASARHAGYCNALAGAGIEPDPGLVVERDFLMEGGLPAMTELLRRRRDFTAVFVGNDQMALGALLALERARLRVPQDVSVIGYDDDTFTEYCRPPLTTMRQPVQDMARVAVASILARLRGETYALPSFTATLVVRESTALAPAAAAPRPARRRATA
jgi:LacI family transcriptional regulator